MLESVIKGLLQTVDAAIMAVMPEWVPKILVSGTATAVVISALKSYWYGISFLEAVKWIFVWRVGMLVLWQVAVGLWTLHGIWRDRRKRQD